MVSRWVSAAKLGRWLGPWADAATVPSGVSITDAEVGDVRVRVYSPDRSASRSLLLVPGVHYLGPGDPRFERFACVLAASGKLVVAPFIRDFLELQVTPRVADDVAVAFDHLWEHPDRRGADPVVFSISFGSLPAFRLAASERGERVRALVTFGGYADWEAAVRFALTGEDGGVRHDNADPLNLPVLISNLGAEIPEVASDLEELRAAWLRFCQETWGRPEMKRREGFTPVAEAIATELREGIRERFLIGCGVLPGAVPLCTEALQRGDWRHVDPADAIRAVRCDVHAIHGVSDDVIPHTQLDAMLALVPPTVRARGYRTGLYSHTGRGQGRPSPLAIGRELWTMARMLGALSA